MKVFKKILSVFLSAAIMVSMICVETVGAEAAENRYSVRYESTYTYNGKKMDDCIVLSGITAEEWNHYDSQYKNGKAIYFIVEFEEIANLTVVTYSVMNMQYLICDGQPLSSMENIAMAKTDDSMWEVVLELNKNDSVHKIVLSKIKDITSCNVTVGSTNDAGDIINYYKLGEKIKADFSYGSNDNSGSKKISALKISDLKSYTYTGKNRKAAVTIKDGDYTLKKGTDYTLTYKNCKNIGTASVTIKGKGDYTGSKTLTYKIVPKKTTLKASKKSDTKVKLSWTEVSGAEKYQIYYSTNGGKYKKLTTISGSKTSATISKLDFEKNDYKFKIRSYKTVDGKKYYSSYSKVVTVK